MGNSSNMKVCLVQEEDMETVCGKFATITSKHIYSLQKTKEISPTALYATDLEVFKEDKFVGNNLSAVKNKQAVPRPEEERKIAVVKPMVKEVEVKKEDEKINLKEVKGKAGIQAAFAKATATGSKKTSENKQETSNEKKKAEPAKKAGIANFFSKQASKPLEKKKVTEDKHEEQKLEDGKKDSKEEQSVDKREELSPDASPGKENIANQKL